MKIEVTDKVLYVIKSLAQQGTPIMLIDNELFAIVQYIPADNNVPQTTIEGRNIGSIVERHASGTSIVQATLTMISAQILDLPIELRRYSSHHSWVTFER